MGNKGNNRHVKSLAAPKYAAVHRKELVYMMKPAAGRHTLQSSISLLAFTRKAGIATTGREAMSTIKKKGILVNGRHVSKPKYPIGLNDVVEVVPAKSFYKIGIDERGHVSLDKLDGRSHDERLCKIVQKYKGRKGALMMRLHDGTVMKAAQGAGVNDSVVLDGSNSVKRVVKLKDGGRCTVVAGVHTGSSGTIKQVKEGTSNVRSSLTIEQDGKEFDTLVRNVMAVE
ncbi:MAG TPA: S4 domain-containing protein [Candidatus Acidoferrum sp.]|nr:S4 domain-containing protein [Candidatus Acidoferrum sp.]